MWHDIGTKTKSADVVYVLGLRSHPTYRALYLVVHPAQYVNEWE